MDEMTQQNAALVEQAAAAATSLNEQTRQLKAAVSVFQLSNQPWSVHSDASSAIESDDLGLGRPVRPTSIHGV